MSKGILKVAVVGCLLVHPILNQDNKFEKYLIVWSNHYNYIIEEGSHKRDLVIREMKEYTAKTWYLIWLIFNIF